MIIKKDFGNERDRRESSGDKNNVVRGGRNEAGWVWSERKGCRGFPEHALHEKGLQGQIGVGPLFSSQEERPFLALLINRGLIANKPQINR